MCSLWNDISWSTKTNSASNRLVHGSAMVSRSSCGSGNSDQQSELMKAGTAIRLTMPAKAGWFEVHSAFSGSGGTWILPEATRLRYVGLMNSPPIGSDPMPVDHFEVLTGEHKGRFVDQVGSWEFEAEG